MNVSMTKEETLRVFQRSGLLREGRYSKSWRCKVTTKRYSDVSIPPSVRTESERCVSMHIVYPQKSDVQ